MREYCLRKDYFNLQHMFKCLRFRHFIIPMVSIDLHFRLRDSQVFKLIKSTYLGTRDARVQKKMRPIYHDSDLFIVGTV